MEERGGGGREWRREVEEVESGGERGRGREWRREGEVVESGGERGKW